MARAYSLDLRERVVAAVAAGESCRAVATKFKVSVASVCEVVSAVPSDRKRRGLQGWWPPAICTGGRA